MGKYLFTSESVTKGHPDKLCDQISDAILDSILAQDPNARVACETTCTTGQVMIMGEISTNCYADIPKIARRVVCDVGYNNPNMGFDGNSCSILTAIHEQSPDIALGVDQSLEIKSGNEDEYNLNGAGDQGIIFGFACDETKELMPLPISLAHKLALKLTEVREDGTLPYLRPDGKTQVTIEYNDNNEPVRVDAVVISTQHSADVELSQIREDLTKLVINTVIKDSLIDSHTKIYINPTGRFVTGGPTGDSGLTGRKIIVDTYGGFSRHGGGAFSGKDPSKVDRSAAYAARYVTKNIIAAGLAKRCEIQISYAIGIANPISIMIDTFGTGIIPDDEISNIVSKVFDLRPSAIINNLNLRTPMYEKLAAYGHMGREDLNVPWEKTDKIDEIKKLAGIN